VKLVVPEDRKRKIESRVAKLEKCLDELHRPGQIVDADTKRLITQTEQNLDIARRHLRALNGA
jgi:hypothetical protein